MQALARLWQYALSFVAHETTPFAWNLMTVTGKGALAFFGANMLFFLSYWQALTCSKLWLYTPFSYYSPFKKNFFCTRWGNMDCFIYGLNGTDTQISDETQYFFTMRYIDKNFLSGTEIYLFIVILSQSNKQTIIRMVKIARIIV